MTLHNYSTYANDRCRCPVCTDAHRVYTQLARRRRAERLLDDPTLAVHGSSSTYTNWGCRCRGCTTAHTAEKAGTG